MRSLLRTLAGVLIVAGVLLIVDAGVTLLWQEPVSALYTRLQQGKLDNQLAQLEHHAAAPTPVERRAISRLPPGERRLAFAARALDRQAQVGKALGRIRIPAIGLNKVVVDGTDAGSLRKGPGHYPSTPLPGVHGTVAIAGHRTTYGAPFRNINRVHPGQTITVDMPYGSFDYRVERTRIVPPTATWVTQRVSYDRLVLSACHPLYSAAKRIVVFAKLFKATPKGAAKA
jgi:sortase A